MFYSNVSRRGDNLLVRLINDDGTKDNFKLKYTPILFVNSNSEKSTWKTLHGKNVDPIEIEGMSEAAKFAERYSDVDGFSVYGHDFPFTHQYINQKFTNDIVYKKEMLSIYSIDIETTTESGFPKIENPVEEILIITLMNNVTGKIDVFSRKDFTINSEWVSAPLENITIHVWESEKTLLEQFIQFWKSNQVDIITGWNIQFFDMPYIVARINHLCGEKLCKQLSPFGYVTPKTKNYMNKEIPIVDIVGVSILDYLALYQKFTYTKRESYTLEHISTCELGTTKLDHSEFPTFKSFYQNGWNKFCNYNVVDTVLIKQLDDRLKLIDLVMMIAYIAKINFEEVFSPVKTWDAIIHNSLWKKNVCVPIKQHVNKDSQYEGAYVKDPVIGLQEYIASFDAASLYPSIMQGWNISPETLVYCESSYDVGVSKWLNGEVKISDAIYENNHCVACNGAIFTREFKGIIPENIDHFMEIRSSTKKLMLRKKQEKENVDHNSKEYVALSNEVSYLDVKQQAVKILNNSLYGACGNSHFRHFDIRLARAITTMGQYVIQYVAKKVNEFGYNKCNTKSDIVLYIDTDSNYLGLKEVLHNTIPNFEKFSTEKKIDIMDKICEGPIQKTISKATDDIHKLFNCFRETISFKREALSDRGVFVSKKRYILNVYDMEGVRYHEPKPKIMGLEMIKSSTPHKVRDKLTEAVSVILYGSEDAMGKFVSDYREEFSTYLPEDIAFPRSANNLEEYVGKPIYRKGCPINVKAALIHNHIIKKLKLEEKYKYIASGDKIKYIHLLDNNPYREEVIAFIGALPNEFNLRQYIDYDVMFEKTFLDPLNGIVELLGWNVNQHASLEDFFS